MVSNGRPPPPATATPAPRGLGVALVDADRLRQVGRRVQQHHRRHQLGQRGDGHRLVLGHPDQRVARTRVQHQHMRRAAGPDQGVDARHCASARRAASARPSAGPAWTPAPAIATASMAASAGMATARRAGRLSGRVRRRMRSSRSPSRAPGATGAGAASASRLKAFRQRQPARLTDKRGGHVVRDPFALDADAPRQPPDRGMKEQQDLGRELQQVHQIIVPAHMGQLMGQQGLQQIRRHARDQVRRHQQHRLEPAGRHRRGQPRTRRRPTSPQAHAARQAGDAGLPGRVRPGQAGAQQAPQPRHADPDAQGGQRRAAQPGHGAPQRPRSGPERRRGVRQPAAGNAR